MIEALYAAAFAIMPATLPPEIPRAVVAYRSVLLREIRARHGVAAPNALFFGQVHQESSWRSAVVSRAGAEGLAQFMPSTAEWIQRTYPADLRELCPERTGCPADARWALRAMILYDRALYRESSFRPERERWASVLAAYNGGGRWLAREAAQASQRGLDATRWFDNVERVCIRAAWACQENRAYPRVIMTRWMPLYSRWLGALAGATL